MDASNSGGAVERRRCRAFQARVCAWSANAHAATLVLELVDAELAHEAAQRASAVIAGGDQDGAVVQQFIASGLDFFVATSFSKSFSLYGERVGALNVVCADADEAARVLSQLKVAIRTNYSNPPTHGAQVVATVLDTPALRAQWEQELAAMRQRIKQMRSLLLDKLNARLAADGKQQDFSFITRQRGMFSYSGLSKPQMERLRDEFGVYGVDSGRICVAALNTGNIDHVVSAIAQVI